MPIYKVRREAECYGHDIGILLIDCRTPFIPGDVGNAYTYDYPVLYKTVPDVTLTRLIDEGDLSLTDRVVETARALEASGVAAITSDCGYMMHFQELVAEAVSIPVMLSSLLQLPFIGSLLGPKQSIGLLCANKERLTEDLLARAYPNQPVKIHVAGMERMPNFRGPMLDETDTLDSDAIEREMLATVDHMLAGHPDIGAFLLECSNMPPYAAAIHRHTGRPVFDFVTMINHVAAAVMPKIYSGRY
ncbi:aspartate/glutamate racemase family protein (plasmid) [Aminobacter sp. NyZ550]|uniref:aspartate/glutamate racemase family protein n=1 Tax=unclassified Aminobacter TaxID=2644704 RepID=UPI0021D5F204|nr:aspartate/glutamate racemase family protein [Aminobacter sp. NyZ550]WAX98726.1 aspartate/glutamate racemase family protein [Aminobacter sp. NyZ550]